MIPVERLGSSAALSQALAAKHVSGKDVSKHELLQIAAEIEGHPDNVVRL